MCYDRHVPSYRYVIRNLTLMHYNLQIRSITGDHNVMLFTAAHSAAQELLQVHGKSSQIPVYKKQGKLLSSCHEAVCRMYVGRTFEL